MAKYSFGGLGREEDGVECPQLDALLEDLRRVLDRHGVQFEIETSDYNGASIDMMPYVDGNLHLFVRDLESASKDIPWIKAAKAAYAANVAARREREEAEKRQREIERRQRHAAEHAIAARARQEHMLRHGVEVDGVHYKLVKEEG